MTGLQGHIQHAVRVVLINHLRKAVKTILVRRHNGATDSQITPGKRFINIFRIFLYLNAHRLFSAAVLVSDYYTAIVFHGTNHLFRGSSDRAARNKDSRSLFKMFSFRIFPLNFLSKGIDLVRKSSTVKTECGAVEDFENVVARNGSRVMFHNGIQILQSFICAVIHPCRFPHHFLRNLHFKLLFQIAF